MYIILSTRSAAVCFWTIAFIRTSKVRVPMLSFYVHGSVSLFVYDIAWHSSTTCSTSRSIYLHDCCRRECITEMISIPLFVSPVTSCKDMYVHLWCTRYVNIDFSRVHPLSEPYFLRFSSFPMFHPHLFGAGYLNQHLRNCLKDVVPNTTDSAVASKATAKDVSLSCPSTA